MSGGLFRLEEHMYVVAFLLALLLGIGTGLGNASHNQVSPMDGGGPVGGCTKSPCPDALSSPAPVTASTPAPPDGGGPVGGHG